MYEFVQCELYENKNFLEKKVSIHNITWKQLFYKALIYRIFDKKKYFLLYFFNNHHWDESNLPKRKIVTNEIALVSITKYVYVNLCVKSAYKHYKQIVIHQYIPMSLWICTLKKLM